MDLFMCLEADNFWEVICFHVTDVELASLPVSILGNMRFYHSCLFTSHFEFVLLWQNANQFLGNEHCSLVITKAYTCTVWLTLRSDHEPHAFSPVSVAYLHIANCSFCRDLRRFVIEFLTTVEVQNNFVSIRIRTKFGLLCVLNASTLHGLFPFNIGLLRQRRHHYPEYQCMERFL